MLALMVMEAYLGYENQNRQSRDRGESQNDKPRKNVWMELEK